MERRNYMFSLDVEKMFTNIKRQGLERLEEIERLIDNEGIIRECEKRGNIKKLKVHIG